MVGGALVLLVSILVGQKLGDRVLLQTEKRVPIVDAGVTPVPTADASDRTFLKNWKRLQGVAVATHPAFPAPRATRPPPPPPPPPPAAAPSRAGGDDPGDLPLAAAGHSARLARPERHRDRAAGRSARYAPVGGSQASPLYALPQVLLRRT